jgi:hypothetical protein
MIGRYTGQGRTFLIECLLALMEELQSPSYDGDLKAAQQRAGERVVERTMERMSESRMRTPSLNQYDPYAGYPTYHTRHW